MMTRNSWRVGAFFAAALAGGLMVGSAMAAPNLILNPSFEAPQNPGPGEVGGGAGTSWNTFNAVFLENQPTIAHDGNQYIKVFGGGSGAFQDIAVIPGQSFSASAWAQLPSSDHAAAGQSQFGQLLVIYRDATDSNNISTLSATMVHFGTGGTDSPSDTWQTGVVNDTVPVGVGFIRIQLNEGASAGGSVFFDDTSLTITPEPASLGLLGVGSLLSLRRRRRV